MNNLNSLEQQIRRVVLIVALANLAYFFVEFQVAQRIGSVSLFADSIDFLEDTTVNLLILVAFAMVFKDALICWNAARLYIADSCNIYALDRMGEI